MKKNYYKVYTILFFVLLSFPAFYTFMKQPELFKDNLPTNLCLTDINDSQNTIANNLSTKDVSMEIAAVINYKLFREPITSQVFFGNNNNFFYAGDQAVDDLTGNYTISDEKLSGICYTQQAIYEELERNGVKYLLVIAPNKETVYPDLLFNKHKNETSEKRKDQIIDALKKNTDVEILDLTEALIDESKINPVYMKTDSHWNYNGSFRGYQEIIKHLRKYYPELPMLTKDDFDITYTQSSGLNLSRLAYLSNIISETDIPIYNPKVPYNAYNVFVDYNDPSPAGPPSDMIILQNDTNKGLPKVMLLGDSFAGYDLKYDNYWNLNCFMAESFSRYVKYHYYQAPLNIDLVQKEGSDIVIREYLESNLERLDEMYVAGTQHYTLGTPILFLENGNANDIFSEGLSICEGEWTWSDGDRTTANIYVDTEITSDLLMKINTHMIFRQSYNNQIVNLYINNNFVGSVEVFNDNEKFEFIIPKEYCKDNMLNIVFEYPNAEIPNDVKDSPDARKLAIAYREITISNKD